MKKKIITILILNIILLFCISTTIFAIDTSLYEPASPEGYSEFTKIGGSYISVIQYVGIILGVIIIAIIGLKYMLGSVEEKAEYKKTMIPYIVGCVFLMCSSTFVGLFAGIHENNGEIYIEKKDTYSVQYSCSDCGKEVTEIENKRGICDCGETEFVKKYYCASCGGELGPREQHNGKCDCGAYVL